MKRLISKKIMAYDEAVEQFINKCEDSGKFDYKQMREICYGFGNDLTIEEVKLYAKPEFNIEQMEQIRWGLKGGLKDGLSIQQVELYAKPEFDYKQMKQIRWGFEERLLMGEVELYAKPEIDWEQMQDIRMDLGLNSMSIDEVKEKYNL